MIIVIRLFVEILKIRNIFFPLKIAFLRYVFLYGVNAKTEERLLITFLNFELFLIVYILIII